MKAAIITIAGISSRFNEGIPANEQCQKALYYQGNKDNTLLFHLLNKCLFADRIMLVCGNRFNEVKDYYALLPKNVKEKTELVYNEHYEDLSSGYSLYVGIKALFEKYKDIEEVLFVEGDLDVDDASFQKVVDSSKDVLTYSFEPIYANKAVVLYSNAENRYKYAFNSSHGLLQIEEPFSVILNSGQIWKFKNTERLKAANEKFYNENKEDSNLGIIRNYVDASDSREFDLVGLLRWMNCNTRDDYQKILGYWEENV